MTMRDQHVVEKPVSVRDRFTSLHGRAVTHQIDTIVRQINRGFAHHNFINISTSEAIALRDVFLLIEWDEPQRREEAIARDQHVEQ